MKVEITGVATKIDAIFRFDQDLWKGIQKGVKDATESVAADARIRIPTRGLYSTTGRGWGLWTESTKGRDLSFDQAKIRAGIKTSFKSRYKSGFREVSGRAVTNSAAGAIYALAGSVNSSGSSFNTFINLQQGNNVWPRALTPAYYAKGPEAAREIARVIERAIDDVNRA